MLKIKDEIGLKRLGYEIEARTYQYTDEVRLFLAKGDEEIGEIFEQDEIVFWSEEDEKKLIKANIVEKVGD